MTVGNGSNGIWGRILIALIPISILGVLALASMRSDVRHLQTSLDTKASREVVQSQYEAILRELQNIRAEISSMRRRP